MGRRAIRRSGGKVVTAIGAVLFPDDFGRGLSAFVVNLGIVEFAISAAPDILTAFRAIIPESRSIRKFVDGLALKTANLYQAMSFRVIS